MNDIINQLNTKIAILESQVDLQEAELVHLHEMLIRCGFPEGIATLKATVEEYLSQDTPYSTQQQEGV